MFIAIVLLAVVAGCVQSQQTELTLPPLPYGYTALEPVLSEHLMRLHHDKHHQAYTTKANEALKDLYNDEKATPPLKDLAKQPIETILAHLSQLPEHYHVALRHNGGGYLNHKLFFSMLRKPTATANDNKPTGQVLEAIEKAFGSFDKFKEMFTSASVKLFGSGWVWLYIDAQTKQLVLNFTANQDNPIMFDRNHIVVLGIDLWEHAYYPVYENRRNEYIEGYWRLVNWPYVAELYAEGNKKPRDL